MEDARTLSPLTPAAFAYAAACVVVLAVLPHLETPVRLFGAPHAGGVLLGRDAVQGILWGLGAGGAAAALGQAVTRWAPWGRRLTHLLTEILGGLHPADALLLAGLSALGEELVFRGLALPYLGLTGSSLLFGLVHVIPRQGLWPFSIWAAANGFLLGWLALTTGGLLASALAHFLVNAVGLLLLSQHAGGDPEP